MSRELLQAILATAGTPVRYGSTLSAAEMEVAVAERRVLEIGVVRSMGDAQVWFEPATSFSLDSYRGWISSGYIVFPRPIPAELRRGSDVLWDDTDDAYPEFKIHPLEACAVYADFQAGNMFDVSSRRHDSVLGHTGGKGPRSRIVMCSASRGLDYAIAKFCSGSAVRLSTPDRALMLGAERSGVSFLSDNVERQAWFVSIVSLPGGDIAVGVATTAKAPRSATELLADPAIRAVLDTVSIEFYRPAT